MKTQGKPNGNPPVTKLASVSCHFCRKTDGHEPWCQISPEWIALEAVFSVAEGISEVTTIETLYSLAKLRPDTECLTLQMVRELVHAWAELGEWEDVGGRYRKAAGNTAVQEREI